MKSGVSYSAGSGTIDATNVHYDGLSSESVKEALDQVSTDLTASDGLQFKFATDGEGNYGYLKADGSFVPFKSSSEPSSMLIKYLAMSVTGADNFSTNIIELSGLTPGGEYSVFINFQWSTSGGYAQTYRIYDESGAIIGNTSHTQVGVNDWKPTVEFIATTEKAYIRAGHGYNNNTQVINVVEALPNGVYYLYKDGVENVAWDNSGSCSVNSGYTSLGGFTLSDNVMIVDYPTSNTQCRTIVTNNTVDLTAYSKLCIIFNNGSNKVIDLTDVSISTYVAITALKTSGAKCILRVYGLTNKSYLDDYYAFRVDLETDPSTLTNRTIDKVWLEK